MSDVGFPQNFIDTQGISLENQTDGDIYDQILSMTPVNISNSVELNQLTNDTVEKLFGLTDAVIEVEMMATQPELLDLFQLTLPTGAQLPSKIWKASLADVSNNIQTITGTASLTNLEIIDDGISFATLKFKLEFFSGSTISAAGTKQVLTF